MPVIAIVGAGPGMGLSLARTFGSQGFAVALVARTRGKLDELVTELGKSGIEAAGFTADILDRPSLVAALAQIKERFGGVDVLEFSPAPHNRVPGHTMVGPVEMTVEELQMQFEYNVHAAVTAAAQVLPEMIETGAGTLLFTTGGGSVSPNTGMGNVNAAQAALRNWVLNLHQALAGTGVYAAHVAINAWIGSGAAAAEADTIAAVYWDLYTQRTAPEVVYSA